FPSTQPEPVAEQDGPARRRQAMLGRLADPRLTGMTTTDLQQLAALLAPTQAARTQQRYAEQRGGRARRGAGKLRGKPLFDDAARLLLTLGQQRQLCSMTVLADLLEVTETCIGSLVHETREVLEDHSYSPTIASMRVATSAAPCTRPAKCSKPTATAPPSPRCGSPPPPTCSPSLTRTSVQPGPRSST